MPDSYDREVVRQSIAHALGDELKREEEREENVRRRIATMRKGPKPGTIAKSSDRRRARASRCGPSHLRRP